MDKKVIMVFSILIVIIAGLTSFILYNKFVSNISNKDKNSENGNIILSIDDEFVRNLYYYVKTTGAADAEFNFRSDDGIVYASSLGIAEKSYLAYKNVSLSMDGCSESDPEMSFDDSTGKTWSACGQSDDYGGVIYMWFLSKEYTASYKEIFGDNSGYPIAINFCNQKIALDTSSQKYIIYSAEGGCDAIAEPTKKLISVKMIDDKIELIESVTYFEENKITKAIDYKYTFKKDKTGHYIYYSVEPVRS